MPSGEGSRIATATGRRKSERMATAASRPSNLPFPSSPPTTRDDLPDRGAGAPGSWGLRAAARLFDIVLIWYPCALLAGALGVEVVDGEVVGPRWPSFLFPVVFVLYETLLVGRFGQTAGKWLCRIKVVDWDSGNLPPVSNALIRAAVPAMFLALSLLGGALSYLIFVVPLIYLTSIADSVYRGLHDKAARTIVLSAPRGR